MADSIYYSAYKGAEIDEAVGRAKSGGALDVAVNAKQNQLTPGDGIDLYTNPSGQTVIKSKADSDVFDFETTGELKLKPSGVASEIRDPMANALKSVLKISELSDHADYLNKTQLETDYQKKLTADDGIDATKLAANKVAVKIDDETLKVSVNPSRIGELEVQDVDLATTAAANKTLADIVPSISWLTPGGDDDYLVNEYAMREAIALNNGYYRGAFDSLATLTSTEYYMISRLYPCTVPSGATRECMNNDYAYVTSTTSEGTFVNKYKAVATYSETMGKWWLTAWEFEYKFKVSAFTQREADALASGITAAKVAILDDLGLNALTKRVADTWYKKLQSEVVDPVAVGNGTSFISNISQNSEGVITVSKKTVPEATDTENGLMSASDKAKLITVASGANVVTPYDVDLSSGKANINGKDQQFYVLPKASATTLGGVKVGTGLVINSEGKISADIPSTFVKNVEKDTSVSIDTLRFTKADGTELVYTPSSSGVADVQLNGTSVVTGGVAEIPVATGAQLGVVKAGDNVSIDSVTGKLSATDHTYTFSALAGSLLINSYPEGTSQILGGIGKSYGLAITAGTGTGKDLVKIEEGSSTGSIYLPLYTLGKDSTDSNKIQILRNSAEVNFIEVHEAPAVSVEDTTGHVKSLKVDKYGHISAATDKTFGRGLSEVSNEIGHSNVVIAGGTKGETADVDFSDDATSAFKVLDAKYDTYGHLIADINERTVKLESFAAATSTAAGKKGLVPKPVAGDNVKMLQGDGTWALPKNRYATGSITITATAGSATITCLGMTGDDHAIVDLLLTAYDEDAAAAWSYVYAAESSTDTCTISWGDGATEKTVNVQIVY